ncbi:zinc-binding dehydrogenase [Streptomyces sp. NPDC002889]|uniref:zinc-binding dehydrogenase n=1 Tax=Streptomyces sp. NPDC002889 TaxID=3364669 RepID=UPI0036AB9A67
MPGIKGQRLIVTPDGEALHRISTLIDTGVVHVEVQDVLPLHMAAEAHRTSKIGQVRGKLLLTL